MFGDDEEIRSDKDLAEDYRRGMEAQDRLIEQYRKDNEALLAERNRLREYVEADCRCPWCATYRNCIDGCRMREIEPGMHYRMVAARKSMWGENTKGPAE